MSRQGEHDGLRPGSERRSPGWLLTGLLVMGLCYPIHAFKHHTNDNEAGRIYLVEALVERGVFNIDEGIRLHGDIVDKAAYGGHFYCDKPPGLSLAAMPVYGVMHAISASTGRVWSYAALRYVFTVVCVSLPTVLAGRWLWRQWRMWTGDSAVADLALLLYAFGTPALTYSTQFIGHQFAAVLAVAHWARAKRNADSPGRMGLFVAGLLLGYGAISDYFSTFLHLLIVLSYAPMLCNWRRLAVWGLGAIVGCCPLLIYNAVCFGHPFSMAYAHEATEAFQQVHSVGFLGVGRPTFEAVFGLLLSPAKGLLFLSPALALGIAAIMLLKRGEPRRREVMLCLACVLVIGGLACSLGEWKAGWTIGPRHMVSCLPFLMTLVVLALNRYRALLPWAGGVGMASVVMISMATLTFPVFDPGFGNPIGGQSWFLFRSGFVSPNLGELLGLRGAWSLFPVGLGIVGGLVVCMRRLMMGAGGVPRLIWSATALLGLGYVMAVMSFDGDSKGRLMLLQGRVLGLTDHLPQSAERLEEALRVNPTVETAGAALPLLQWVYQETGDQAGLRRTESRIRALTGQP